MIHYSMNVYIVWFGMCVPDKIQLEMNATCLRSCPNALEARIGCPRDTTSLLSNLVIEWSLLKDVS